MLTFACTRPQDVASILCQLSCTRHNCCDAAHAKMVMSCRTSSRCLHHGCKTDVERTSRVEIHTRRDDIVATSRNTTQDNAACQAKTKHHANCTRLALFWCLPQHITHQLGWLPFTKRGTLYMLCMYIYKKSHVYKKNIFQF